MTAVLDRLTALYRFYDANGALLYVGISCQPDVRFKQHEADKAWWPQVALADVTWYDDRLTAAVAEAKAIVDESPLWNIATPDEDGRYTIGTGRPLWDAATDEQRELLAKLDKVAARIGKDVGELWQIIESAQSAGVPTDLLAKLGGVGRATIYRRLGRGSE